MSVDLTSGHDGGSARARYARRCYGVKAPTPIAGVVYAVVFAIVGDTLHLCHIGEFTATAGQIAARRLPRPKQGPRRRGWKAHLRA